MKFLLVHYFNDSDSYSYDGESYEPNSNEFKINLHNGMLSEKVDIIATKNIYNRKRSELFDFLECTAIAIVAATAIIAVTALTDGMGDFLAEPLIEEADAAITGADAGAAGADAGADAGAAGADAGANAGAAGADAGEDAGADAGKEAKGLKNFISNSKIAKDIKDLKTGKKIIDKGSIYKRARVVSVTATVSAAVITLKKSHKGNDDTSGNTSGNTSGMNYEKTIQYINFVLSSLNTDSIKYFKIFLEKNKDIIESNQTPLHLAECMNTINNGFEGSDKEKQNLFSYIYGSSSYVSDNYKYLLDILMTLYTYNPTKDSKYALKIIYKQGSKKLDGEQLHAEIIKYVVFIAIVIMNDSTFNYTESYKTAYNDKDYTQYGYDSTIAYLEFVDKNNKNNVKTVTTTNLAHVIGVSHQLIKNPTQNDNIAKSDTYNKYRQTPAGEVF